MKGPTFLVGKGPNAVLHPLVTSSKSGHGYGFGPAPGWGGLPAAISRVPGQIELEYPYDAHGNLVPGFSCEPVSSSECVETCMMRTAEAAQKNPPWYNLGTFQCNDWAAQVVRDCRVLCGEAP